MLVRTTAPEEDGKINELFSLAFALPQSMGPANGQRPQRHWAVFDEATGQMTSAISASDYDVHFDWASCRMAGIGGVSTLPQYRRQGGIRACFQKALPELYDESYDFSYLFPFSNAFYRQFGYESCVRKLVVRLNPKLLNPDPVEGHFCLADPSMLEAIQAVDRVWESRYNMSVVHGEEDYNWFRDMAPAESLEFTYLYFERDNIPQAYAAIRSVTEDGVRRLKCRRFFFLSREGFQGLMHLFQTMACDYDTVSFVVPGSCDMEYLLPEWSLGALQMTLAPYGMVRVINVEEVLKKCHCHGCVGRLTIELHDPMIPQNNDTFTVDWRDGHVTAVERTKLEPDAVLDISAFSALIAGACDLDQAELWMKGLKVLKPESYPSLMFYRKPMMITDFF